MTPCSYRIMRKFQARNPREAMVDLEVILPKERLGETQRNVRESRLLRFCIPRKTTP